MNYKNEKQLLIFIRFALPILALLFTIAITTFLYIEKKTKFNKLTEEIQSTFIKNKKQTIKEQIDNLYYYIVSEQKDLQENLEKSLSYEVKQTHKIAKNIYYRYKHNHSKDEIKEMIKAAIREIRFNNDRAYFFIIDKEGKNQLHPIMPELEGKDVYNTRDSKGSYIVKEPLELLKKKDEIFYNWYWVKSQEDKKEYKKIGFIKNFHELNWVIGTGEYLEEFSKDTQEKILKQIEKLRYGKNSYFIVTNKDEKYISHVNKNLINKDVFKILEETNTTESIDTIKKILKTKEGFVTLDFFKPNSNVVSSKIIYLKNIPNWGWTISTGFYVDDASKAIEDEKKRIEKEYQENLKNLLFIFLISIIILVPLFFYISFIIEKKFKKYKDSIQEHIDENQKQYKLLAQKSKLTAMGEMLANIAHQWKQPLSLITTSTSSIKLNKELGIKDDEFLYKSIDNIQINANHLAETINDFMDFFRPDKNKNKFFMKDVIAKTLKLLSSQFQAKKIEIIQQIQDISIISYERELLQVLLNIISNSKDAILENSIENGLIFIEIYKNENNVIIEIKDNAKGINENIKERIFEPYFTTKNKAQGTGIGLYMSQEIITKHMNGTIEVDNIQYEYNKQIEKGAIFKITLPISN
ncbi:cache domain-containing protein [Arcobacter arenosus]|uniref:histidine kinase n=1 Tax=Arcobacter arenosus TaxID=2576037 RepID=A0A5R8Y108_9BACT|nr:cache domain-containing protein [Arcobacter arenosus]TLP38447.1 histidine kinase [Arcobacter arenosus]